MPRTRPPYQPEFPLEPIGSGRSIGSRVGDALDNALAESFVDSFKTELIADSVWRTRPQLELATLEYIGWFNGSLWVPKTALLMDPWVVAGQAGD